MKQLLAVFLVALVGITNAQDKKPLKLGHIDASELMMVMPERAEAEKKLQELAKQLEGQLTSMSLEYEKKINDYQANLKVMSEPVKEAKEVEITDLERRIRDFQMKAQESLQKKENEFMTPIIEKAQAAIQDVAKELGYTYVFDTSAGVLVHFPETDDLLIPVKKKLGL